MKIFAFLLVVLALVTGVAFWAANDFQRAGPLERPVTIIFPPGTRFEQIADSLGEAKVIAHRDLFKLQVFLRGNSARFKAGEYNFQPGISQSDVAEMISSGKAVKRHLTIAEGLMTFEILELIRKEPALSGEIILDIKEGELLPETYFFSYGDKRNDMVARMRNAMQKVKEEAWAGRERDLPLTTPEQMITLASIVEKETALAEERSHVASVYVNRLRKNMLLQADPTTVYAVTKGKFRLERPLSLADLALESPYNTYKTPGLPPTPIANPGKASILASVHPLKTEDIYFVADGKGGHTFAKTYAEHNENVRKYRALQKAGNN